MMQPTMRVNLTEFTQTLKRYANYSERDPAAILNTKGLFIALRALLETPKASAKSITKDLGRIVRTGKNAGNVRLARRPGQAPLAALIINKRRGKGRGLSGAAMRDAIRKLIGGRLASLAFIKSGWLPSIRKFSPLADVRGRPRQDRNAKQRGRDKGYGKPARKSWRPVAEIANTADARHDKKNALLVYGAPALQRAVGAESRSMVAYMEKKLADSARRAGIKVG